MENNDLPVERSRSLLHRANQAFFFVGGFGTASWAPLVPLLKERLAVEEDMLGLLLLCIGVGSLLTMPLAGSLAGRFGCRRVIAADSLVFAGLLLLLAWVDRIYLAVPALLAFGASMGIIDVTVNIHAVRVEQLLKKRVMSGMHALWSVGGFLGAGLFGVWMMLGFTPLGATACSSAFIALLVLAFARFLLAGRSDSSGSVLAVPSGVVVFVAAVAFVSFLVEGAVMDWSGVFLTTVRGMDLSLAGMGFSVFSGAMLLMRFLGDHVIQRVGQFSVAVGGALLAFVGILLVMFAPVNTLLYLGFFAIGIGSANIVPVFFSLMGRQSVMPVGTAVSAVSTMGYLGILAGPAAIGFVSAQTNLMTAFGMIAALCIVQALVGFYIFKKIV